MNYLAVLLGAFMAFSANNYSSLPVDSNEWAEFKLQHGKSYESAEMDSLKQSIYAFNKQRVDSFHANEKEMAEHFQLELNHMADMSEFEMMQINGFRGKSPQLSASQQVNLRNSPKEQQFLDAILADDSIEVPDSLDWRTVEGRVSAVKNQGQCGSCWTFASTGTLEGQEIVRPKLLLRKNSTAAPITLLSEQNLVDCVKADYGCQGGLMEDALRYINTEGGIDDEQSYPYEGLTGKCRFQKAKVAFSDTGAVVLPVGDEQKLKEVVAKFGPVAVAIDASSIWFQFYRHGVYVNKHCKNKEDQLDHAVLVVGYGTDPKKGDYWIVKNSWGGHWGEKGYIRMARNKNNMCGIATVATIPTF